VSLFEGEVIFRLYLPIGYFVHATEDEVRGVQFDGPSDAVVEQQTRVRRLTEALHEIGQSMGWSVSNPHLVNPVLNPGLPGRSGIAVLTWSATERLSGPVPEVPSA
jgi:hypothetical protein